MKIIFYSGLNKVWNCSKHIWLFAAWAKESSSLANNFKEFNLGQQLFQWFLENCNLYNNFAPSINDKHERIWIFQKKRYQIQDSRQQFFLCKYQKFPHASSRWSLYRGTNNFFNNYSIRSVTKKAKKHIHGF